MPIKFRPARLVEYLNAQLMQMLNNPYVAGYAAPFLPYGNTSSSFLLPKSMVPEALPEQLPLPPRSLWNDKSHSVDQYLSLGQQHVATMREMVAGSGFDFSQPGRILDLGSGSGRLIRHLTDLATHRQIWGVDISTEHVVWCQQYLSPPFFFAVTTIYPHLPFEDQSFDLIYAGSVFTHIDDLTIAWLLELHRILKPNGRLYITIHDKHTIQLLATKYHHSWLARFLSKQTAYRHYAASNFAMFTILRSAASCHAPRDLVKWQC